MLRRAALKAFGSSGDAREELPRAPHEIDRRAALDRLFRDLHAALAAAAEDHPAVRATPPRALSTGLELTLEGPSVTLRFLHALAGGIRVSRGGDAELAIPGETLSVQQQGGAYRPILKPGGRRQPFRFTSVPELAAGYLRETIQKIDTPGGPPYHASGGVDSEVK